MKLLKEFLRGDGAHCGLADWYPEQEAALKAALKAHAAFDTGWYSSKKEIASARVFSRVGEKSVKVEVSVSDDFDTVGLGYCSTTEWNLEAVASAIDKAWTDAKADQEANAPYVGFSIIQNEKDWVETYLLSNGEFDAPPGDSYYNWGWQHDADDGVGTPHPNIPLPVVAAFENWAEQWARGKTTEKFFHMGEWKIKPWREAPRSYEDPSDWVGMGWVGADGRP
jgi:hypothetical protein